MDVSLDGWLRDGMTGSGIRNVEDAASKYNDCCKEGEKMEVFLIFGGLALINLLVLVAAYLIGAKQGFEEGRKTR